MHMRRGRLAASSFTGSPLAPKLTTVLFVVGFLFTACSSNNTPPPATAPTTPATTPPATATPATPAPITATPAPATATPTASFSIASVQNSVVLVSTDGTFVTPDGAKEQGFVGTGFVVDSTACNGTCSLIVTNNHVVTGGAFWSVTPDSGGNALPASLVAASECDDLALLKVQGTFPALKLATVAPIVTTPIFVAGHPNGESYTVTNGTIAKGPYASDTSWASVTQELQITAQTFPGNSGSPILDANGSVVGIEYAAGNTGSAIQGESFAISASEAAPIIEKLKSGRNPDEFYLGINSEAAGINSGVDVISVAPGSPADKAGIKAGDRMTNLNGTSVGTDGTKATYCAVLRSHPDSTDVLSVTVQRGGEILTGEFNGQALAVTGGGPSPAPTATATGGTPMSTLMADVPDIIATTCTPDTTSAAPGSDASLSCTAAGVDAVFYDHFPAAAAMRAYYTGSVTAVGATTDNSGDCSQGGSLDIGYSITFNDGKKLSGPDYRLLCYKDAKGAWLIQEDPADLVVVTIAEVDGNQANLYTWWTKNSTTLDPEP